MDRKDYKPRVSVLMPNYNGETYIKQTISSVLDQTFKEFEFIIIDDGSTDNSVEIIKSFKDDRIVFIQNERNMRLPATFNKGIEMAKGEYIARIDSDDICMPDRLEKQVDFMDKHPEIGVCGTAARLIYGETPSKEKLIFPAEPNFLKAMLLFDTTFLHPTVMLRSKILKENNIKFSPEYTYAEDYLLWVQLSDYTQFYNLKAPLVYRRIHPNQVTAKRKELKKYPSSVRQLQLKKIGIEPSEEERELHDSLSSYEFGSSAEYYKAVNVWFAKILEYNKKAGCYFSEKELITLLIEYWLKLLNSTVKRNLFAFYYFFKAPLPFSNKLNVLFAGIIKKIKMLQ